MSTKSSRELSRSVGLSSEADLQGSPISAPKSLLSRLFRENDELLLGKALDLRYGGRASLFKIRMGMI